MKQKILFISNITGKKIGSFSLASIIAANKKELEFHMAANFNASSIEQQKLDEETYNIKLHQIDFVRNPLNPRNIKAYQQLVDLIRTEKFDIIHCNTPVGGVCGRIAGKQCSIKKVIYQAHGFHFYKGAPLLNWIVYFPIEKILAHWTDALITINKEDYVIAEKFHLRKNGRVYYVPGVGIDLRLYNSKSGEREVLRKEFDLKDEDIACISMGDLIPRKNYAVAIEAIAQCKNEHIQYFICGKGDELARLKKLAQKLDIESQIHFLGFRSDIKELLKMADIFLFTSLQEGLPRSTMEAMATGLPVACSRIRGNTDLIDENLGGIMFNPAKVSEVVEALKKLFSMDYISMGKYNLNKIQKFSLDTVSEKILEVYEKEC